MRMDLEGIMLSEICQSERQILCDLTCVWNLKNVKIIDIQSRIVVPGNGVERNTERFIKGYMLPFIRWIGSGDLIHSMAIMLTILLYYLIQSC